jgi:hypothetical protein
MKIFPHPNPRPGCWLRQTFLGVFLFEFTAAANPISIPEKSVAPENAFLIITAILIEIFCVYLVLRRTQKPRFFPGWLIGMHLFTYPAFLGFLWIFHDIRPSFAVAIGECLVVLVEGGLIYLMCRYLRPADPNLRAPSPMKCLFASFIGNAFSAGSFPILVAVFDRLSSH